MGSIIKPICNCNHPFKELLLGGGMSDMGEKCYVPFFCETCGTITRKNGIKRNQRCVKCKNILVMMGEFIPITDENIDEMDTNKYIFNWEVNFDEFYGLENKMYKCPKCKSQNLQFIGIGCWD